MKAQRTTWWAVAIAVLLTAGVAARAQEPGGPGFGEHRPPFERALGPQGKQGRWWNNPEMVEKLKLTDDQRKQMDDILQQHRETLVDLRGAVEKSELELEPLMRDDQPNEAKILAQIDKVAQARAELEKANARFLLALRGKLTPEQWKLVQAERGKRHEDRPGWGQRDHGQGNHMHASPPPPPGQPGPQGKLENGDEDPGAPGEGAGQ